MKKKVIMFGVDGLIPELVYKFTEEGHLPNFKKMISEGASSKLLPFISTWGDVNWVSFLSGQSPGTSWIGQRRPPENKSNLLGLINDMDEKCALVHFPESLAVEGTNHFCFAPFWSGTGSPPFELAAPTVYSTNLDQRSNKKNNEFLGWPRAGKGTLAHHEKANRKLIVIKPDEYSFRIRPDNGEDVIVGLKQSGKNRLSLKIGNSNTDIVLEVNDWSDWINVQLGNEAGLVKFKLLKFDPQKDEIEILQTQINKKLGFSNNASLEDELINQCGPFISKWTVKASPDELYYETSFEEGEYQAQWLANAALTLLNDKGYSLFSTVFRLNDETHHTCLGKCDPSSPFYNASEASKYENTILRSYKVLDVAIGRMLEGKTENTILIVASDHGDVPNHYLCDIYRRLEEFDLCKLNEQGEPVMEETKAYLKDERGGLEIFVNLKGREKNGIVDSSEYEQVQTEIFRALSTWYHETPDGLKNVVSLTVKKQDAEMIGYWGDNVGDIIFAYNLGFVWGMNAGLDVVAPVSFHGANHGPQIPSASTNYSSNHGVILMYGPSVKRGIKHNDELYGQYRMNDAGTTIAHLLNVNAVNTLDGTIMNDLVEE